MITFRNQIQSKEHDVPFLDKGTLVTLDHKTQQANIVRKQQLKKLEKDTKEPLSPLRASVNSRLNRASLLIQR